MSRVDVKRTLRIASLDVANGREAGINRDGAEYFDAREPPEPRPGIFLSTILSDVKRARGEAAGKTSGRQKSQMISAASAIVTDQKNPASFNKLCAQPSSLGPP
jgi:hypothetical protein